MTSRLTEWVIDSRDPERLAEFWCAVLDYHVVSRDGGEVEIAGLPGAPSILFEWARDEKLHKNRVHLDLNAVGVDQETELQRLLDLGATHVDIGQGEQTWVVLADPEGNEFCLLRSTVQAEPAPLRD
jgi:catechol-2,3-dioxygenase